MLKSGERVSLRGGNSQISIAVLKVGSKSLRTPVFHSHMCFMNIQFQMRSMAVGISVHLATRAWVRSDTDCRSLSIKNRVNSDKAKLSVLLNVINKVFKNMYNTSKLLLSQNHLKKKTFLSFLLLSSTFPILSVKLQTDRTFLFIIFYTLYIIYYFLINKHHL